MRLTKTLAAVAVATTALTSTAFAGGLAVEVIEPPLEIIEPQVTRSSWGIILPIAAVALLVALASSDSASGS